MKGILVVVVKWRHRDPIHDISPYVSWCTAELRISSSVKPKKLIFWYDYIILNPNEISKLFWFSFHEVPSVNTDTC